MMFDLITRLPGERFQSRLFFLKEAGVLGRELFLRGVEGTENLARSRFDVTALWRLSLRLRSFRPDILFSLDHRNAIILGGLSWIAAGSPKSVVASHSTRRFGGKANFTRLERIFLRLAERVVALSDTHAGYLRDVEGIDASKIVVVENGIDMDRYREVGPAELEKIRRDIGLSPEERVVIMVAALRPEKAHESLLKAAQHLIVSHPDVKFLIVGDGPLRGHLEALSEAMQLQEKVRFLGVRGDVAGLLHLSSVLVLPSHPVVETLPLAVLEAMAARVPVVASSVGSIPDLIEDGMSGKLIPPAAPESLAGAIETILDDPAAAGQMAARAFQIVEGKYTVDRMVSKYAALFEKLIS